MLASAAGCTKPLFTLAWDRNRRKQLGRFRVCWVSFLLYVKNRIFGTLVGGQPRHDVLSDFASFRCRRCWLHVRPFGSEHVTGRDTSKSHSMPCRGNAFLSSFAKRKENDELTPTQLLLLIAVCTPDGERGIYLRHEPILLHICMAYFYTLAERRD